MQAATLDAPIAAPATALDLARLRDVVLVRAAAGTKGVARTAIADDLAPYLSHRLSPAQWRQVLDEQLAALLAAGLITLAGTKVEPTDAGKARALSALGTKPPLPATWAEIRDTRLVALALGLEKETAKRLKALARPEGLRAAILQRAYNLKIKGVPTPSRLRAGLASVALARAFGNRSRDSLGGKLGLSAKAGRLLAGQLVRKPRDFGTDARLVAALAAEQADALQTDMGALQQAVLRRFLDPKAKPLARPVRQPARKPRAAKPGAATPAPRAPTPASLPIAEPTPVLALVEPPLATRPDLAGFGQTVRALAAKDAQGWSGNRKTYISHLWRRVREEHASWGLSEIEFKCMLAEAHRAGHVSLANADLKDAKSLKDVQESAVVYKNAVFHFVRVEA